jgi:uncharacterized protein (TIGR01319 family)
MSEIKTILATDCGSTTTKAILIEQVEGEYRLIVRGEAPTTVEAPFEDVTRGVINAITEVEELSQRVFLDGDEMIIPPRDGKGVDAYISTSSAGGGLQMMVAGVVKNMTAESATRAALGAGAIVMDVIASNDGRLPHEKIDLIRKLRPDMILLSGGTDGGSEQALELAELIKAANPRPRLGSGYNLPIIFGGNTALQDVIRDTLEGVSALSIVDNLRPVLERENLNPARDKIHDLFMEHVMQQAPGYSKLMSMTRTADKQIDIMPTPGAVGLIMQAIAEDEKINVVGVDIGGATTDVFSVFGNVFNRTVSANLGMSYSVANVLAEAGLSNILRWVRSDIDEEDLRNRIGNKMIRPTTIPQTKEELMVEQAIAREALRLAFVQHREFAVELKGVQQKRTISDAFDQSESGRSLVKMMELDLLVGSGGVLSHAPRRVEAAHMLVDAFLPEGFTRLAVDSIFMMPQLGVLTEVHRQAATEVFKKDCLIHLGTCIAPRGSLLRGGIALTIKGKLTDGSDFNHEIEANELRLLELPLEPVELTFEPARTLDMGEGKGKPVTRTVTGGVVGLIVDTRGRPFNFTRDTRDRQALLDKWDICL